MFVIMNMKDNNKTQLFLMNYKKIYVYDESCSGFVAGFDWWRLLYPNGGFPVLHLLG